MYVYWRMLRVDSDFYTVYRFSDIRTIANIIAHSTPQGERKLIPSQIDDLRRVLTYCNDSFSCRRTHILDPFEDDSVGTGGQWLQNLRTTKLDLRDCDKCDVCEERNTRLEGEWFEKINEKYLTAVDEAFRNDFETSVSTLANRVCAVEGIRTTVRRAEETIEYLVVAGYLILDLNFRGRGFMTTVRPVSKAVRLGYQRFNFLF
jgi:hypothetical protein